MFSASCVSASFKRTSLLKRPPVKRGCTKPAAKFQAAARGSIKSTNAVLLVPAAPVKEILGKNAFLALSTRESMARNFKNAAIRSGRLSSNCEGKPADNAAGSLGKLATDLIAISLCPAG